MSRTFWQISSTDICQQVGQIFRKRKGCLMEFVEKRNDLENRKCWFNCWDIWREKFLEKMTSRKNVKGQRINNGTTAYFPHQPQIYWQNRSKSSSFCNLGLCEVACLYVLLLISLFFNFSIFVCLKSQCYCFLPSWLSPSLSALSSAW